MGFGGTPDPSVDVQVPLTFSPWVEVDEGYFVNVEHITSVSAAGPTSTTIRLVSGGFIEVPIGTDAVMEVIAGFVRR